VARKVCRFDTWYGACYALYSTADAHRHTPDVTASAATAREELVAAGCAVSACGETKRSRCGSILPLSLV